MYILFFKILLFDGEMAFDMFSAQKMRMSVMHLSNGVMGLYIHLAAANQFSQIEISSSIAVVN
jgi:hypothetical protein